MESDDSQNTVTRATRRSTRQSTAKASNIEAREPIKRTKRRIENTAQEAAENGAKETNNASGDTKSPNKKRRLEEDELMDGDEDDSLDVEPEAHLEKQKLQEKGLSLDSLHPSQQPDYLNSFPFGSAQTPGLFEVNSLTPSGFLACSQSGQNIDLGVMRNKAVERPRSKRVSSAKSAHPLGSQEDRPKIQRPKSRSIADYQQTMASGVPKGTHYVPVGYSKSGVSYTPKQHVNNVSQQKLNQRKIQGVKKSAIKPAVEVIHGSSPRGFCWYLTRLVCLLLLSAAVLLAYKKAPALQNLAGVGENSTKKVKLVEFSAKWSDLQSQFPGQRHELWKRSRIHLERHLQAPRPTEPVSLILVAGRRAERTLYCLAKGLATTFSAAHNASVLHIDGAAAAGQDSDRVKLDIDSQLRGAFGGGDRPAAVIHRLEELPPGSTLIFYRYCDHENAAYKQVFLAFTVLLPQDHLETQHSLKEVEEMVQDYIAERFVGSGSRAAFDRMDADKLSGLWSRISHLILPVAAESQVELNGCELSQDEKEAPSEQA